MRALEGFVCCLLLLCGVSSVHAFTETIGNNVSRDLSVSAGDGADGLTDLFIETNFCSGLPRFSHLNSSARIQESTGDTYAGMTYGEAVAQNPSQVGPFCPQDGDLFYVKTAGLSTGSTADDRFYKLRIVSHTATNVQVEYLWLGTGVPSPPVSAFSFSTYDLFGIFTDTSSGTPSGWAWGFGDATSSPQQHPRHRYASAATRTVTLAASNAGGADVTPASQMVAVSERPSTLVAQGGTFDFDGNAVADIQVVAGSGCDGGSGHLETRNGAGVGLLGSDYRNVTAADIAGNPFSVTNFCSNIDYLDSFMVKTGAQSIYKAWIARNNAGGIRLEFAQLQAGPPPPPVTSFAFASYDLITDFNDTSTGAPSSWAWNFGDAAVSTLQDPRHRYATAGSRSACLIASNIGGAGSQVCQNVVVNQVVSTTVATNGSISLDGDAVADLQVQASGGCPVTNLLAHLNGTGNFTLAKDYRNVVAADASGVTYATGPFCVDVDFLSPFLVRTTSGAIYKAWTAGNDASGIRLQYALLVPVTIFANGFEN